MELKEVKYPCWGYGFEDFPRFNKAVYVIKGNSCYFSGIEKKKSTSTINAAEEIVKAIVTQENVSVHVLCYFDIQTYKGYHKFPGEYEVDELIISPEGGKGFHVSSWDPTVLPDNICDLFQEYIGVNLKSMYSEVVQESEGLFCIRDKNGRFFYVREDGVPISKEKYFDLTKFRNGFAWACRPDDYKWAKMDRHGNICSEWVESSEFFG